MTLATTAPVAPVPSRYELLDVFRGFAALSVVAFHAVNSFATVFGSFIEFKQRAATSLLLLGWNGVYLFFPISGFCILAASHSQANAGVGTFLQRRWRRIFPTYWASIVFVVIVTLASAPFSHDAVRTLLEPGLGWLSILTLTQNLTGLSHAINPVYWSLCYEEQFYLLIALTMLAHERQRPALLFALSLFTVVARTEPFRPLLPQGLFIDCWMNFAVGLAVFGWNDPRYGRWWSGALFLLAAITMMTPSRAELAIDASAKLAISTGAAVLLLVLRPLDQSLASWRLLAPLGSLGVFSYSLYLTHLPMTDSMVRLAGRTGMTIAWWPVVVICAVAAALVVAWAFYRLVERHFLNSRRVGLAAGRMPEPALAVEV
ncbi:MAG: acyltransferase [Acidobacteriaceae bacterium]|jgi:peptidoglycan/LPS O-acetylase OafA/YrhL|nr:acyltransferase [Acidobacteriaceae bacterium]